MCATDNNTEFRDSECKRSGFDRRRFSYSYHIPERRSGKDRRRELDRRSGLGRRKAREHKRK